MRHLKRRRAGSLGKVAELATPMHKRAAVNARRLGRIKKR
jgi:hypothetical protein